MTSYRACLNPYQYSVVAMSVSRTVCCSVSTNGVTLKFEL